MTGEPDEITIIREVQAHPARVWVAFTTAEGWRAWCCEQAECDGQVGGKFHIFTNGYHAHGVFTELEPESKACFTWHGDGEPAMLNEVRLEATTGGTRLVFKVKVNQPMEDLPAFLAFLQRTWGHALENLQRIIGNEISRGM